MKSVNKYLNYAFIIIGAIVALYAQAGEDQDILILVTGIVLLMIGIYRISKNISHKPKGPEGFIKTDKDDI